MADKKNQDTLDVLAALFRIDTGVEKLPSCPLVTPECIPQPRWEAILAAAATGQPWVWGDDEKGHLSTCGFCRRRERLIPVRAGAPLADQNRDPSQRTQDTVAPAQGAQDTIGVSPERTHPDGELEALLRPAVEAIVAPVVARGSFLNSAALKIAIETALNTVWPQAPLTGFQRRMLWKLAALAVGSDQCTTVILLAEGGGLTNREIASVLGISERDVVRERVFGG